MSDTYDVKADGYNGTTAERDGDAVRFRTQVWGSSRNVTITVDGQKLADALAAMDFTASGDTGDGEPVYIDRDGDAWERVSAGRYRFRRGSLVRSLGTLRRIYGPLSVPVATAPEVPDVAAPPVPVHTLSARVDRLSDRVADADGLAATVDRLVDRVTDLEGKVADLSAKPVPAPNGLVPGDRYKDSDGDVWTVQADGTLTYYEGGPRMDSLDAVRRRYSVTVHKVVGE